MPPKAKRWRVWFKDPLMNTWRPLTGPLTKADADKLIGQVYYETKKEEYEDDSE